MKASASFILDEQHYQQYYAEWLKNISKWRKWSIVAGIALICIGTGMLIFSSHRGIIHYTFILVGIIEIITTIKHKHSWLKDRRENNNFNKSINIGISANEISIETETSSSKGSLSDLYGCIGTPKGIVLYLKKGIHIYIPDAFLSPPEAKEEVLEIVKSSIKAT